MFIYWTMYGLPAFYTLLLGTSDPNKRRSHIGMAVLLTIFAILIGLRYDVGTDWVNYLRVVNLLHYTGFSGALGYKDPGFGIVTWLSVRLGFGIYGADMVSGMVLMLGIWQFARRQPDAWLSVTAAIPYLVIVVGMGYVRQAAAIGFILVAITRFEDRRYPSFMGWMVLAAVFHAPSVCILPLAGIALTWERRELLIPIGLLTVIIFLVLLSGRISRFYSVYIDADFSSSGAIIRLVMNAVPGVLFLLARKRFVGDPRSKLLWTFFALVTLSMLAIFPVFPSSTALDRMSLYFIPIQLMVFGRLPILFGRTPQGARLVSYLSILYYGAALFVWLFYADNSHNWLPYQFAPFVSATAS